MLGGTATATTTAGFETGFKASADLNSSADSSILLERSKRFINWSAIGGVNAILSIGERAYNFLKGKSRYRETVGI